MTSTVFKSYSLENDLEMAELILAGLPAVVLGSVGAFLGLRAEKVGSIVNIKEKTLGRRPQQPPVPQDHGRRRCSHLS